MAVAAFDGRIIIYALNTMGMKNGVEVNFQPVKEVSASYQRTIGVKMSYGCFRNCTWM